VAISVESSVTNPSLIGSGAVMPPDATAANDGPSGSFRFTEFVLCLNCSGAGDGSLAKAANRFETKLFLGESCLKTSNTDIGLRIVMREQYRSAPDRSRLYKSEPERTDGTGKHSLIYNRLYMVATDRSRLYRSEQDRPRFQRVDQDRSTVD
jgi:hypothetical protein